MTLLELCQALIEEGGISGLTDFTTAQNQSGEGLRVVNWIKRSWNELQTKHDDWDWLRSSVLLGGGAGCSFTTVNGTSVYPLGSGAGTVGVTAANFGKWDRDSFRLYTTAVGNNDEQFLDWIPYDSWRNGYMFGTQQTVRTRPIVLSIAPTKAICLGPPPTAGYTVIGDYFRSPTAMSANADTPTGLPEQFHMAIVYKAMRKYGLYEAAGDVIQRADSEYGKIMAPLEAKYMPEMGMAGPLA